jgi:hypothetical protein
MLEPKGKTCEEFRPTKHSHIICHDFSPWLLTRERRWSGRCSREPTRVLRFSATRLNFAARLQSLAAPGSVFMSEATHRLVQGRVEVAFAGDHQIKCKAEPRDGATT